GGLGQAGLPAHCLAAGNGRRAIFAYPTCAGNGCGVGFTAFSGGLESGRKGNGDVPPVKVDILGLVENMSHFVCPHCGNEVDIFSKGGGERTARQFDIPLLGSVQLDPKVRQAGDTGRPLALAGKESSPAAKSFYELAERMVERVAEVNAAAPQGVVQIV